MMTILRVHTGKVVFLLPEVECSSFLKALQQNGSQTGDQNENEHLL